MLYKHLTIDDYKIGETVLPLFGAEIIFIIVDIDKKKNKIFCMRPNRSYGYARSFRPEQLSKLKQKKTGIILRLPKP